MDPSGPSLHVGHLVPIFGLLHLQRHGGRPVLLVGGATGMIGDPSGTSAERNLLDRDDDRARTWPAIRAQLERFLDFEPGSGAATLVNNLDWLGGITLLDFLRDVGKHFTVPYMLAKDSVSARLDAGLSYTEFSYMLLQAADFQHLYRTMGVELQVGGADQWGNITAGLELIRRTAAGPTGEAAEAFALSYPLLLDPSGAKFGKTSVGTSVWLDPARTSPYAFYQFLVDRPDTEVGKLLRLFTIMDRAEIEALEAEQAAHPESRPAQRALALDLTTRVHGVAETERAVRVSQAVFGEEPDPRSGRARRRCTTCSTTATSPPRTSPAGRSGSPSRAGCSRRTARRAGRSPGRLLDQRRAGRGARGRGARADRRPVAPPSRAGAVGSASGSARARAGSEARR